ncbi:hypothetical protein HOA92_01245 [archaeon]|jgi:hypothetical protein|nr:hypothetical protein [archaeon]MBT6761643.1 hypothetical protein [archaeon]
MAKRKTTNKKTSRSKKSSRSKASMISPRKTSAHKYNEKMIITAIISIIIIGFVVWTSQDFPAQGQAYQINLELQDQKDISRLSLTSCQSPGGCAYVNSVVEDLKIKNVKINSLSTSTWALIFYDIKGNEVTGTASGNFKEDGVVTVGYQGVRYPINSLIISPDF